MEELYRLVYTSSRKKKCDENEIEKILNSCKKNNPGKNITGVLIHSERRFIQYLEGGKDMIMDLFNQIKKDERHGGVNLRYYSAIDERIFPSWHMGYKDVETNTIKYQTQIRPRDIEAFRSLVEDKVKDEKEGIRVLKLFFEMA